MLSISIHYLLIFLCKSYPLTYFIHTSRFIYRSFYLSKFCLSSFIHTEFFVVCCRVLLTIDFSMIAK